MADNKKTKLANQYDELPVIDLDDLQEGYSVSDETKKETDNGKGENE